MTRRLSLLGLLIVLVFAAPEGTSTVSAQTRVRQTSLTREQIRQMPILSRPYRFGHFYGNAVRRTHMRRMRGR